MTAYVLTNCEGRHGPHSFQTRRAPWRMHPHPAHPDKRQVFFASRWRTVLGDSTLRAPQGEAWRVVFEEDQHD